MYLVAMCVAGSFALIFGLNRMNKFRQRRELERFSIGPDELYQLMKFKKISVYDVRQPLDFLAHSEIIPGAIRLSPKEVTQQAASLPREQDSVIYCTCPGDETSRMILAKARALKFIHVKLLKGGLAAWKERGYPVERYDKPFQLDTAS
jgi:rhodanese-related sulfurtransferase